MFMMPMPPTISDIDATAASRSAMMRLLLSAVSAIWLRLRTEKSLMSPGRIWCRRVRISVTSADCRLNLAGIGCLDIDLVHVAHQSLLKVVGIGR